MKSMSLGMAIQQLASALNVFKPKSRKPVGRIFFITCLIASTALSGCGGGAVMQPACPYSREELREIKRQAKAGDAEMQFRLAKMYYYSTPCGNTNWLPVYNPGAFSTKSRRYRIGRELMHEAAEQGHINAQVQLGRMYTQGSWGSEKNLTKAMFWYRKAAEQGDASGQYELGRFYHQGIGVEQDPEQARFWYQKAADQGNIPSKNFLKVKCELDPVGCEKSAEE